MLKKIGKRNNEHDIWISINIFGEFSVIIGYNIYIFGDPCVTFVCPRTKKMLVIIGYNIFILDLTFFSFIVKLYLYTKFI